MALTTDALGDLCDADRDGDGIGNLRDNCIDLANPEQTNTDRDNLGDRCDARECFVVRGTDGTFDEEATCLDPNATVRTFSPRQVTAPGEVLALPIFSNRPAPRWAREDLRFGYRWRVVGKPPGANTLLFNAEGQCNAESYLCAYAPDAPAALVVDRAGSYQIELSAALLESDPNGDQLPRNAPTIVIAVQASGDAVCLPTSCAGQTDAGAQDGGIGQPADLSANDARVAD